jgi:hypothetical protein
LKWSYLSSQLCVWDEPKNKLNNHLWPNFCASLWCMQPICYTMLDDRKSTEGSSLGPLKNENTALFSLHADPSCTMRLGGRLGKVWDSPDDLGRVYGCGKTDQHTKSIEGVTFGAPEK